jgi:tetratricopeptide (TPR) repeat protein
MKMFTQRRIIRLALICLAAMVLLSCGGAEERKAKYMERAKTFLAENNYDKARVELKNVLQIDPKYAEAYFLMGQINEKKQEMREAFAAYSKAVELDPGQEQAREKLARFYLMSGAPDKAKEMTDYILKNKPNDPTAKTINAVLLAQKNDLDAALKLVSEVVKADPKQTEAVEFMSEIYKNKGNAGQAIAVLTSGIANNPKDIGLRSALAQLYIEGKDYTKAAEVLQAIVELEPDLLQHRVKLASLYSQTNQPEKAEKVLRDAIKANPKDSERYIVLAEFLMEHNALAQAESEILGAIKSYPNEMGLRFALAKFYQKTAKTDLANNTYQKIIDINGLGPDGMRARTLLAELLLNENKVEEASRLVAVVLKENAQDPRALLIRGKLALSGDKPDLQSAIADFRTILKSQPDSVEVLTLLAKAHLLNHEPDLARESLQIAVKSAPKDAAARFRLADFLIGNDKDIDGAEKVLDDFLAISPDNLLALQAKLEILFKKKDDSAIIPLLARIKKIAPDKPIGYYRSAEYYLSQEKYQDALHDFEQARDRSKGDFRAVGAIANIYVKIGKPEAALKELDEYLKVSPKSLDALQMKASVLASMNDTPGVLKLVGELKQLYPDKAYGYGLAGEFYLRQKNYDNALREFMSAAEKSPDDGRISVAILKTYLGANKPDEALTWLEQQVKNRPNDGINHYLMAEVLSSQKKYAEAEAELQKALQLMPARDVENMPKRSEVYIRLADVNVMQNHLDDAVKVLKQGLAVIPNDNSLSIRLASVYELSGKYDDAIATYDEILKSDPGNILVANNVASLLTDRKGDKASLERARQLAAPFESSGQPALLDTLGWVYYKQNDIDSALPLLKKAVDAAPKSGVLRYHLGMAYYKKGDKAAAKDELTRAFATGEKFAGEDEGRAILKTLQ